MQVYLIQLLQGIWYEGRHVTGDLLMRHCGGYRLLYMFSGPDRPDGVDAVCRALGSQAEMLDLHQPMPTNLADSHEWQAIEKRLRDGHYHAMLTSPPCDTFSRARAPLRDEGVPGIYGKSDMPHEYKADVQNGTLLALLRSEGELEKLLDVS